jgi:hypothetical protein
MKYELLIIVFVLYQSLICVLMWRWVKIREIRLRMLVGDRQLDSTRLQGPVVLTHARWRRKTVLALFILMIGLEFVFVLGTGSSIEDFSWPWFMVGVAIVVGLCWGPWALVAEAYGIAIVLDDYSITRLSPWSRERTIKWADVESVTYSWFWAWFTLRTTKGSVHVTTVISGLEKFAQDLVLQVPRDRIRVSDEFINKALQGPFRY